MPKIAVIGAGTMGHGIAELFAIAGYEVALVDIAEDFLKKALQNIEWSLRKLAEKGQVKEDPSVILSRIKPIVNDVCKAVEGAELMVEAAVENIDVKKKVFSEADRCAPPNAILATNTSSLPITEIAEAVRPERKPLVVGMHFFNPPVLMPLVEIIKGAYTSDETVKKIADYAAKLGKQTVVVNKDVPGFIVNRILARVNEAACWMVARGEATIQEVDSALMYKAGLPMGAFILMDYTGIDVVCFIGDAMLKRGFKSHPCPVITQKCQEKKFGVKSGEGFYKYPAPGKFQWPEVPKSAGDKIDVTYLLAPAVNEAAYLLREGIATREDIDKAVKLGLNWPKGPLEFADELGIDAVVKALETWRQKTGYEEYEPDPLLKEMVSQGKTGKKAGEGFYTYVKAEEKKLETLIVRYEPGVAWIILNRPERLNAINPKMVEELWRVLDEIEQMDYEKVRVVVITGAGRAFSAGADVTGFMGATPVTIFKVSRKLQMLYERLELLDRPVICGLNGYTLGGGLELAMACDFRIAAETAELGQPEINLGFIPGAGGTQRLARLIGRDRAKELIFTGDRIPAREAERLGLVHKVVSPDKLEQELRAFAAKLAEKPPLALAMAKYAINFGLEAPQWVGMMLEATQFGLLFSTEDVIEGVSSFLQKKKPQFKGR
ncbi:MAG: 3-hydroxyacyl-CoA dehydrogenase/enoyl-CoA hydratase family protein [Pyrobaculum arsenaticum]|uniref:3-hydroxyacyl-CoA dehydrogenase, NAD-binding protein n=2 Tax=Pyrobaculum arsenaticum TaxID=121277 RepID=A4WI34_PYRAR|nr:3-hydroxyacyl-CoA dehydrogenase/enoyl-CoA hydratase family protein [Pyrobaculum arsenaticum]ABP50051.1 3-hydroxyacyl-CoA dehydrogenase, NAD-binding protein [Pyrobaculum arsenaticum DSM 13514]MCY0889643.1 3-hydroxyacyl-CoA dehydrogenase/enoyl-CoA hydratase family protein [Pyrobaculum arsenaticum]NYR14980.1 3-hydroxyacyl-CoA dehydrogenase/enoyl-CoA hydratase family protein [Pyrobaculum arsenaticum]